MADALPPSPDVADRRLPDALASLLTDGSPSARDADGGGDDDGDGDDGGGDYYDASTVGGEWEGTIGGDAAATAQPCGRTAAARIHRAVADVLAYPATTLVLLVLTLWVLFGTDVRTAAFEGGVDGVFEGISTACFVCFIAELLARCAVETRVVWARDGSGAVPRRARCCRLDGYAFSLLMLLDCVAIVSLLPDMAWAWDSINASAGPSAQLSNARASRVSRIGSKLGRLVRMVRVVRLVKLYSLWRGAEARRPPSAPPHGHASGDEPALARESQLGQRLADVTTRTIILLVLVMLLVTPVLLYAPDDGGRAATAELLHAASVARWPGGSGPGSGGDALWAAAAAPLAARVLAWPANAGLLSADVGAPLLVLLALAPPDGVPPALAVDLPATYSILRDDATSTPEIERFGFSTVVPGGAPNGSDVTVATDVWFNVRPLARVSAVYTIGLTLFVIGLLLGGAILLSADAHAAVLRPIEAMIALVERVAVDPDATWGGGDSASGGAVPADGGGGGGAGDAHAETRLLSNAIRKVVGVLRVGLGTRGVEVVARHLDTRRRAAAVAGGWRGGDDAGAPAPPAFTLPLPSPADIAAAVEAVAASAAPSVPPAPLPSSGRGGARAAPVTSTAAADDGLATSATSTMDGAFVGVVGTRSGGGAAGTPLQPGVAAPSIAAPGVAPSPATTAPLATRAASPPAPAASVGARPSDVVVSVPLSPRHPSPSPTATVHRHDELVAGGVGAELPPPSHPLPHPRLLPAHTAPAAAVDGGGPAAAFDAAARASLFDPFRRGRAVRAVFVTARIPRFDDLLRALGPRVVGYANCLAKVVHDAGVEWGGAVVDGAGDGGREVTLVWVAEDWAASAEARVREEEGDAAAVVAGGAHASTTPDDDGGASPPSMAPPRTSRRWQSARRQPEDAMAEPAPGAGPPPRRRSIVVASVSAARAAAGPRRASLDSVTAGSPLRGGEAAAAGGSWRAPSAAARRGSAVVPPRRTSVALGAMLTGALADADSSADNSASSSVGGHAAERAAQQRAAAQQQQQQQQRVHAPPPAAEGRSPLAPLPSARFVANRLRISAAGDAAPPPLRRSASQPSDEAAAATAAWGGIDGEERGGVKAADSATGDGAARAAAALSTHGQGVSAAAAAATAGPADADAAATPPVPSDGSAETPRHPLAAAPAASSAQSRMPSRRDRRGSVAAEHRRRVLRAAVAEAADRALHAVLHAVAALLRSFDVADAAASARAVATAAVDAATASAATRGSAPPNARHIRGADAAAVAQRLAGLRPALHFGVDVGWAVEGAVGTVTKVGAAYASPHAATARRLARRGEDTGVAVLLSGATAACLSPPLWSACRLVDVERAPVAQHARSGESRSSEWAAAPVWTCDVWDFGAHMSPADVAAAGTVSGQGGAARRGKAAGVAGDVLPSPAAAAAAADNPAFDDVAGGAAAAQCAPRAGSTLGLLRLVDLLDAGGDDSADAYDGALAGAPPRARCISVLGAGDFIEHPVRAAVYAAGASADSSGGGGGGVRALRAPFASPSGAAFRSLHAAGMAAYLSGAWPAARDLFERACDCLPPGAELAAGGSADGGDAAAAHAASRGATAVQRDPATADVYCFMQARGFVAPDGWAGIRDRSFKCK